jgi:tetratricopeptide (TPR) repeat protein
VTTASYTTDDAVAKELALRAAHIAPQDPVGAARALVELGIHVERGRGDVSVARRFYEESRTLVRLFEPALDRLRRIVQASVEPEVMLGLVDDAIVAAETDRARADLFGERARLLAALGRLAEARAAFEEALGLVPEHPAALRGLEAVLRADESAGSVAALAKHLETLAERYAPAESKADGDARLTAWMLVERATILEERLAQPDLALASLERAIAFESTPGPVRDALTRHLVRNDRAQALVQALAGEAEREPDDARASRLDYAAARILATRLETPEDAIPLLERAASRAPSNTKAAWRALTHLVGLLEEAGHWEPAASVRQRRLALLTEPDAISFEQVRLSAIFDLIGRADRAALHAARALEITPDDPSTLERLDRALLRLGRHDDRLHAWAAQANADRPASVRVASLVRAADIAERHLGRRDEALTLLRAAWSIDPSSQDVFDALSALLAARPAGAGGDQAHVRARIDLYAQAAAAAESPARRLAMLEKLALLWEEEVGDHGRAIEALDQVLAVEPQRLSAILAMERNAERAGQAPKLVSALVAEAGLTADPALARKLLLRAAEVTSSRIGDRDRALALVGRALDMDGDDPDALRALARHSERGGRHGEARAALVRLVKATPDPRAKFAVWLEIATLDELRRKDPHAAVQALQNAALARPTNPHPHAEIVRLLRGAGDHEALATALLALAAASRSPARAADLYFDAAEVQLLALGRDEGALQSLLAAEGTFTESEYDPCTLETAERILVRRGAHEGRAALYTRWLERKPAPAIDHAIRVALAELLAPSSPEQSAAILRDLLRVVPSHVPALRMLEHLHRAMRDDRALAAVLRAQADVVGARAARCGALWEHARVAPRGEGDEALDVLSRIASLDPADGAALDGILHLAAQPREPQPAAADGESAPRSMRSPSLLLTALAAKKELAQGPVSRSMLETERCLLLERMGAADSSALATALSGYRAALALWPESMLAARGVERLATQLGDRSALLESQLALSGLVLSDDERARCFVRAAELVAAQGGDGAEARATELHEKALAADADCAPAAEALVRLLARSPDRLVDSFRVALEKAATDAQIFALGKAIGDSVLRAEGAGAASPEPGVGIAAMRRALEKRPDDVPALLVMARLQRAQRLFPDARETLVRVVEVARDTESLTVAHFSLAELYEGPLGRVDLAESAIQAILKLDARNKRALNRQYELAKARGDRGRAQHALTVLVEIAAHPTERTEAGMRLAEACMEAEDRAAAVRALCDAVVTSPPDPRPWAALARLFREGTPEGAAAYADALKQLLEMAAARRLPIDPRWLTTLGHLEATTLSRPAEAIGHLQHAAALPGALPDARALLGRALEAALRHVEAIQVLRTLFTVDVETGARIEDLGAALASLEAALAKEGRMEERLAAEEVRACLGLVSADRFATLRARRLPETAPRIAALAGPELGRMLLPEARSPLLDLCAAIQPISGKALRIELATFGIGSRDRIGPRDGHLTRALADRIARALGVEAFELYLSPVWQGAARVYPGDPPAIIAATSFADLPEPEQMFALARLLVRAALGPTFLDELTAEALDGFLLASIRTVDPGFGAGELARPRELAAQGLMAHVQRAIGRRQKKLIEELVLPVLLPGFDVRPFSLALRRTEYRAALVLSGDVVAAIDHLRRIEAARIPDDARALLKHPVTSELLRFALLPESCAERRRLGTLITA